MLQGIFHGLAKHPPYLAVTGYAMDGGVGVIVLPCAVIDDFIGRIISTTKDEGCHDIAVVLADVTVAAIDVCGKLLDGWIAGGPLVGIACNGHKLACDGEYLDHLGNVG